MKKLLFIIMIIPFFASCKKDEVSATPTPQPVDDARTILLKEVIEQGMPDPYYRFVYDAQDYVTDINFSDGHNIYTVEYENKRVKKMTNIQNGNTMLYNYTNGQVTRIDEFNPANIKVLVHEMQYNANGQLTVVTRKEYFSTRSGLLYKKYELAYHADGNLDSIALYIADNGVLVLTNTRIFSDYDDQTNVDDFYLIHDLFDSFLFLPQVKLQLNNPRNEKTIRGANSFDINYTYQFSNHLPITKSGVMTQTAGGGNGQPFHFTHRFTYY